MPWYFQKIGYSELLELIKYHGKSAYLLILLFFPGKISLFRHGCEVEQSNFVELLQIEGEEIFQFDIEYILVLALRVLVEKVNGFDELVENAHFSSLGLSEVDPKILLVLEEVDIFEEFATEEGEGLIPHFVLKFFIVEESHGDS